jgi:hypothetical protein
MISGPWNNLGTLNLSEEELSRPLTPTLSTRPWQHLLCDARPITHSKLFPYRFLTTSLRRSSPAPSPRRSPRVHGSISCATLGPSLTRSSFPTGASRPRVATHESGHNCFRRRSQMWCIEVHLRSWKPCPSPQPCRAK